MSEKSSSRREGGFTLIELLVVMAIIALMALIAAPWFVKLAQRNQLKSAAREIQTSLLAARMSAVKRNIPARTQITEALPTQTAHLVEIFEETPPTPRLVNRVEITKLVDFNPSPPPTVVFGGDGRNTTGTRIEFNVRGIAGAAVTNEVTIRVEPSGKVSAILPTDWK
jgi:prepilin-type N-terminal cleavage/methylation domain-containing protein